MDQAARNIGIQQFLKYLLRIQIRSQEIRQEETPQPRQLPHIEPIRLPRHHLLLPSHYTEPIRQHPHHSQQHQQHSQIEQPLRQVTIELLLVFGAESPTGEVAVAVVEAVQEGAAEGVDEDHGEAEAGGHYVGGGVVQVDGHYEDLHGVADHHGQGVEEQLFIGGSFGSAHLQ